MGNAGSASKKAADEERLSGSPAPRGGTPGFVIGGYPQTPGTVSTAASPSVAGAARGAAGGAGGVAYSDGSAGTIPTVFRWEHGGANVSITGTFNAWGRRPMHRSGNDFLYIADLPKGRHAYKFVVDEEWRFAPDQPTVADASGNINNVVDLTTFSGADDLNGGKSNRDTFPDVPWGHNVPGEDEFSKEPPLLPPHLRQIILNSGPPDGSTDPLQLQPPQHVTVNHLYCTAIKGDGLMVQATTQRYRRKHVTTVFYCVMPMSSSAAAAALREGVLPLPAPAPVIAPGLFFPGGGRAAGLMAGSVPAAAGTSGGASSVPASALPLVSASASSVGAQASGAVEALAARVAQAAAASAAFASQQPSDEAAAVQMMDSAPA